MEDLSEKSETQQWKSGWKKDTFLLRVTVSLQKRIGEKSKLFICPSVSMQSIESWDQM